MSKARSSLKENPTSEQCLEIVEETYKLDYTSYYEDRQYITYEGLFLPIPRYFKAFLIFSIIFSSLSILFGLFYIIIAGILVLSQPTLDIAAIGGMYLLYGSLAIYFGIKDTVTIIKNLKFISEISHLKETTRFH